MHHHPHPSHRSAARCNLQACKFIEGTLAIKTEDLGTEALLNAARTSMNSKIVGAEGDFFAQMVVDAMKVRRASFHPAAHVCTHARRRGRAPAAQLRGMSGH